LGPPWRLRPAGSRARFRSRLAALRHSAALTQRVAVEMATQVELRERLRKIERNEDVDTAPARRFHYEKQMDFFVIDEDEKIEWKHSPVRLSVAVTGPVSVKATLVSSRSRITSVRAQVDECGETGRQDGIATGGEHEFRFEGLAWFEKAALEVGAGLGLSVEMSVVERISTCSLREQSAEVQELRDWLKLLGPVSAAISAKYAELEQAVTEKLAAERAGKPGANSDPMVEAA
jgi:hypothetical protein